MKKRPRVVKTINRPFEDVLLEEVNKVQSLCEKINGKLILFEDSLSELDPPEYMFAPSVELIEAEETAEFINAEVEAINKLIEEALFIGKVVDKSLKMNDLDPAMPFMPEEFLQKINTLKLRRDVQREFMSSVSLRVNEINSVIKNLEIME